MKIGECRLRQQAEEGDIEIKKEKGLLKNNIEVVINGDCSFTGEKYFDLLRLETKSNVRIDISGCPRGIEQRLYQEKEKLEDDPVFLQDAINELRHYPQKIVADIFILPGIRKMKKILESG